MDIHLAEPELLDGLEPSTEAADDELLRQFVATRDEQAFGRLVRRHSALVLGVCRRTLRDEHDAEEAFQATFLVLAAKAARIRVARTIGPWLYGVAYHVAIRAAAKRARRREAALPDDLTMLDDALQNVAECHWRRVLDDEINLLPEKYRSAVVLHYLLGKTNKQVAAELGLSERTVEGRQRRGKELLKRRLMLRNVSLPAALGALIAAGEATAHASDLLMDATIEGGLSFIHGNSGACSAEAVRLAQSEVLAMTSSVAPVSATLVTLVVFGAAIAVAGGDSPAQGQGGGPIREEVSLLAADSAAASLVQAQASDEADPFGSPGQASITQSSTAPVTYTDASPTKDLAVWSDQEKRILTALDRPAVAMDYVEQPLRDVMAMLEDELEANVIFDMPALDDAAISPDIEVSISISDVPLRSSLRLLLHQVGLTYVVKDDVLWITTSEAAHSMLEMRMYDVSSVTSDERAVGELVEVIQQTVEPSGWSPQGEGVIRPLGKGLLAVNQTQEMHDKVAAALNQLESRGLRVESASTSAPAAAAPPAEDEPSAK